MSIIYNLNIFEKKVTQQIMKETVKWFFVSQFPQLTLCHGMEFFQYELFAFTQEKPTILNASTHPLPKTHTPQPQASFFATSS